MNYKKSNDNTRSGESRNIYERAAIDGAWLGLYFVVMFACAVLSMSVPLLNIPAMAMALLVPFIAYRWLRRTHVDCHGLTSFSALWMQGIITFGCGSLILGAAAFVFMRWIDPSFLSDTLRQGIEFYRNAPVESGTEMADTLQQILDHKMLPAPIDVALMWLWLGTFSGSILCMFVAIIVRIKRVAPSSGRADNENANDEQTK